MSNIKKAFESGKAIIPFITCGDPDFKTTADAIYAAVKSGADLIEIGIPFSDPTAEGPIIQGANLRALNAGATTDRIFTFIKELRPNIKIPLLFMAYANVVFSYGAEKFISICKDIKIDGLIIPDLPFEEKEEFYPICKKYGIDLISFIAPSTEERIAMIAKEAEGFIYIVPSLEVNETRSKIKTDLNSIIQIIRGNTDIPCAIELDFFTKEQVKEIINISDGVIIRASIGELFEKYGKDSPMYVEEYIKSLKRVIK